MNDAGAMNGSDSVCEAHSLGRSKGDVALLQRCKEFPNLEQIEIEDEEAWVFIRNSKERFPKLRKIRGIVEEDYRPHISVYDFDDEYDGACGLEEILQGMTELPVVEEIYLRDWGLGFTRGLPESIKNLKSLRILKIEDCDLGKLPESIGYLENLETLDLSNSDRRVIGGFESNHISTLPNTIENLKNLKELKLAGCSLYKLPETIGNLENLQILNLCGSFVQSLPESMRKLSNLKELDLRNNFLLTRIPDFIWEMPALEEVLVDDKLEKTSPFEKLRRTILKLILMEKKQEKWSKNQLSKVLKLRINGIPFFPKN
ncbi:MAG: leucine-rich repeat domain-containing protein [Alphaproteobacteria bacterium]|nr:leucine-rich repeat domain-containing protein [Alphaproteobacteria bacterium]